MVGESVGDPTLPLGYTKAAQALKGGAGVARRIAEMGAIGGAGGAFHAVGTDEENKLGEHVALGAGAGAVGGAAFEVLGKVYNSLTSRAANKKQAEAISAQFDSLDDEGAKALNEVVTQTEQAAASAKASRIDDFLSVKKRVSELKASGLAPAQVQEKINAEWNAAHPEDFITKAINGEREIPAQFAGYNGFERARILIENANKQRAEGKAPALAPEGFRELVAVKWNYDEQAANAIADAYARGDIDALESFYERKIADYQAAKAGAKLDEEATKSLTRKAQKAAQEEKRGIYNVTYNDKQSARISKDIEQVDKAIKYAKGNKDVGAKHIEIRHLSDETKGGYVSDEELLNMGKNLRAYLDEYKEPYIDERGASIYEWENKDGVRFRLVMGNDDRGGTLPALSKPTADENIITFYSDRNLKNPMEFKNPAVAEKLAKRNENLIGENQLTEVSDRARRLPRHSDTGPTMPTDETGSIANEGIIPNLNEKVNSNLNEAEAQTIAAIKAAPQKGRDVASIDESELSAGVVEWLSKNKARVSVGKLDEETARRLGYKYPQDVRLTISGDEVRHTLNRHGENSLLVRESGQKPTMPEDVSKWREYARTADKVAVGKDDLNQEVILSGKQINGYCVIVESVRKKGNELAFKDMYFEKGKLEDTKAFKEAQTLLRGYEPDANSFASKNENIIPNLNEKVNRDLTSLTDQRKALLGDYGEAMLKGDKAKSDALEKQIDELNAQIDNIKKESNASHDEHGANGASDNGRDRAGGEDANSRGNESPRSGAEYQNQSAGSMGDGRTTSGSIQGSGQTAIPSREAGRVSEELSSMERPKSAPSDSPSLRGDSADEVVSNEANPNPKPNEPQGSELTDERIGAAIENTQDPKIKAELQKLNADYHLAQWLDERKGVSASDIRYSRVRTSRGGASTVDTPSAYHTTYTPATYESNYAAEYLTTKGDVQKILNGKADENTLYNLKSDLEALSNPDDPRMEDMIYRRVPAIKTDGKREWVEYADGAREEIAQPRFNDIAFTSDGKEYILRGETQERWLKAFDLKSINDEFTPQIPKEAAEKIGKEIKLKRGSLLKIVARNRENFIELIRPTLEKPDLIFKDGARDYIFAKRFNDKLFFANIGADFDTHITIISSHIKRNKEIENALGKAESEVIYRSPNFGGSVREQSSIQTFTDARSSANRNGNESIIPNSSGKVNNKLENGGEVLYLDGKAPNILAEAFKGATFRAQPDAPIISNLNEKVNSNLKESISKTETVANSNLNAEPRIVGYHHGKPVYDRAPDGWREVGGGYFSNGKSRFGGEYKQIKVADESFYEKAKTGEYGARLIDDENGYAKAQRWENRRAARDEALKKYDDALNSPDKAERANAQAKRDFVYHAWQEMDRLRNGALRTGNYSEEGWGELIKRNASRERRTFEDAMRITPNPAFGENFAEFYHDGVGAVKKLLAEKRGQVAGAFHKEGLGDIDAVWGKAWQDEKGAIKGYGLSKIEAKHKEQGDFKAWSDDISAALDDIVNNGKLDPQNGVNTIKLFRDGAEYRIGLSKGWDGKGENNWVITAYEFKKNKVSGKTSDDTAFTDKRPLSNPDRAIIPKSAQNVNSNLNVEDAPFYPNAATAGETELKKYFDFWRIPKNQKGDYPLTDDFHAFRLLKELAYKHGFSDKNILKQQQKHTIEHFKKFRESETPPTHGEIEKRFIEYAPKWRGDIERFYDIHPAPEFGKNFAEFYHDGAGAVKKLLAQKRGQVAGAFYKEGLGDIDLVWGDSEKGLAHILQRRGEQWGEDKARAFVERLDEIIEKATPAQGRGDRIELIAPDSTVILAKTDRNRFVLTAFKEKGNAKKLGRGNYQHPHDDSFTDKSISDGEASDVLLSNRDESIIPNLNEKVNSNLNAKIQKELGEEAGAELRAYDEKVSENVARINKELERENIAFAREFMKARSGLDEKTMKAIDALEPEQRAKAINKANANALKKQGRALENKARELRAAGKTEQADIAEALAAQAKKEWQYRASGADLC